MTFRTINPATEDVIAEYPANTPEEVEAALDTATAAFAIDGPPKCSGLEVAHYSPQTLAQELGEGFKLLEEHFETHATPFQTTQKFQYSLFRRTE